MPKGIVANRSPYDGRHGFSKDLIEVCTTWNLGHPKSSPNPNKDALEFNLIRDVILSDYAELRKTVVGLGFPVVAEIWQKIQNCLQKIRREQSGAHAKTVKTWKERSKKKRDEEKGVAGSAYDTYLKKSKKSKKKKRDEEKGVAGSAYDTSLKKKVKDRALAVRNLRAHRMEKYPSLQQIQLSEGALFWQYTLIYFIKPWPQFDHLTLHEAVLSRKWLIYFGLTRQELIREVFGFLWRNGRLGENGQIYRSVLVLPDGDPKIRPRRAGSRLEGQANNSISNTMALAMGFKFCEVFAARTLDDVDQMETMLQKTQERSCIEAKTCDVPDRVHGVPHHLHRHWTRATDSEEKLELAKPGEPLESACVFMSYVKITEASSANLLHPLYIEGVLNPKRDLHVDLVGGQRLRVVN